MQHPRCGRVPTVLDFREGKIRKIFLTWNGDGAMMLVARLDNLSWQAKRIRLPYAVSPSASRRTNLATAAATSNVQGQARSHRRAGHAFRLHVFLNRLAPNPGNADPATRSPQGGKHADLLPMSSCRNGVAWKTRLRIEAVNPCANKGHGQAL